MEWVRTSIEKIKEHWVVTLLTILISAIFFVSHIFGGPSNPTELYDLFKKYTQRSVLIIVPQLSGNSQVSDRTVVKVDKHQLESKSCENSKDGIDKFLISCRGNEETVINFRIIDENCAPYPYKGSLGATITVPVPNCK